MKKEYMAPQLQIEQIIADTSISSCVNGDCGYTGIRIIACAEKDDMIVGTYRQDVNSYTYCVNWDDVCS